jgi:hypothetical protein
MLSSCRPPDTYGAVGGVAKERDRRRLDAQVHTVQNTVSCIKEKLYITSFQELETR